MSGVDPHTSSLQSPGLHAFQSPSCVSNLQSHSLFLFLGRHVHARRWLQAVAPWLLRAPRPPSRPGLGKGSPLSLQELVSSLQASGPVDREFDRGGYCLLKSGRLADLGRLQGAQRLPWTLDGAAGCSRARCLEVFNLLPEDLRRRAEVEQQAERRYTGYKNRPRG